MAGSLSTVARPNVLFLMSDQHRADVAGFAGDRVARTPVLDALAASGVVFRNAYTPAPICIPGRQSLMTGLLPRNCGCRNFGQDIAPGSLTFARVFARHAYDAVCSGKLHHFGPDQMQGWTRRLAPDAVVGERFIADRVEAEFARYQPEGGTGKWSNQKEIERAGVGTGPFQRFDLRATGAACDFIRDHFANPYHDRPGHHRPLLLKLSLLQPHYPYLTDEGKFNYYLNRVPIFQQARSEHPVLGRTQNGPDVHATPRELRRATAAYYGMVETMDAHLGEVLEALRHVGQDLDDWIIVYTTDHGEMLGQHGIWEKKQFYEASARVPLIVRWPHRIKPRSVEHNVSLCDLFATLCDLCGLPVPPRLDSRSLAPLLSGAAAGFSDEAVSQYGDWVMIKQGRLKYQYYGKDGPDVLFDLGLNPEETSDFSHHQEYREPMEVFRRRLLELGVTPA